MPNGNLTTKEYLHRIDQKLEDFLKNYDSDKADHKDKHDDDKQEHNKEHGIMWKLIIGLPSGIFLLFALIKVFGG